ncbi:hypothetical protein HFP51_13690 [Parasphingopyxis sp. CP4]|uniref:Stf0 family sulfotransferase n=1 Tax=Parasphingopyxis sp. CP4 TaxID=2724527 RepID=UPI0015A39CD4|nr:Stf0 family sulfotransferase [Parasphingopyxis sp. CP4]QLC23144.1 hypothetical protein HFP51_13690 [Parasphingopyxis sp. CP4]
MEACFNSRMSAAVKNELVLPSDPTDFGDAPDHLLLILFASRCGSSYAGHLLANTPHFDQVREAFNVGHLAQVREKHNLADDGEAARWMITRHGTSKAFAAKCGQPGLIGAWHLGYLEAKFDRMNCLVLERRDRVAQAVSLFRAELSGRFHSPQKAAREVQLDDYDREKISVFHAVIDQVYDSLHRFLALTGKSYRTVYYEDICADPEAFVRDTCADMDLPMPATFDAEVRLEVLRDELSVEWIDRFKHGR